MPIRDVDALARGQPQWRPQDGPILPGRCSGQVHHVQPPGVRRVDRACERMLAGADEPLSMLGVRREVGASRRQRSDCFRDVPGPSPARDLRAGREAERIA